MKREYSEDLAKSAREAEIERALFASSNPSERPSVTQAPEAPAQARKSGPGSRYVEVPAEAISGKLASMGFTEDVFGGEIVFKLVHKKCKHVTICVYTSLPARGGDARGCGEDAIRVTAVYQKEWKGRPFTRVMFKGKRVHRTGSVEGVLTRMYERSREAYAAVSEQLKDQQKTCFECCPRRPS